MAKASGTVAGLSKPTHRSSLHTFSAPRVAALHKSAAGSTSPSQDDAQRNEASSHSVSSAPGIAESRQRAPGSTSPSHDETSGGPTVQSKSSTPRAPVPRQSGSASPSQDEAQRDDPGDPKAPPGVDKRAPIRQSGSASPSQDEAQTREKLSTVVLPDIADHGEQQNQQQQPPPSHEARPRSFRRTPDLVVLPGNAAGRHFYDLVRITAHELWKRRLDVNKDVFLRIELPAEIVANMEDAFPEMIRSCYLSSETNRWEDVSTEHSRVEKLAHHVRGVFVMSPVEREELSMHHYLGMEPSAAADQSVGESGWNSMEECFDMLTANASSHAAPGPCVHNAVPLSLHARLEEDPLLEVSKHALPRLTCDLDSDELCGAVDAPSVNGWRLRLGKEFSTEHMQSVKYGLMRLSILAPTSHDKIWLGIHQDSLQRLNLLLIEKTRGKNAGRTDGGACTNVLDHSTLLLDPRFLDAHGIDYYYFSQKASEIVVTLPGAVFQTISTGPGFSLERHIGIRKFWVRTARERLRCIRSCKFFEEDSDESEFAPIRRLIYDDERDLIVREPEAVRMHPDVDLDQPLSFDAHTAACEAPVEENDRPAPSKVQISDAVQKACHDVRGSRDAWEARFLLEDSDNEVESTASNTSGRASASGPAVGTHKRTKHDRMVENLTQHLEKFEEALVANALKKSKQKQTKCVREHERADRIYAQCQADTAVNGTPPKKKQNGGAVAQRTVTTTPIASRDADDDDHDDGPTAGGEDSRSAPGTPGSDFGPRQQAAPLDSSPRKQPTAVSANVGASVQTQSSQRHGVCERQATATVVVGSVAPLELSQLRGGGDSTADIVAPAITATAIVGDGPPIQLSQLREGGGGGGDDSQQRSRSDSQSSSVNAAPGPSGLQKKRKNKRRIESVSSQQSENDAQKSTPPAKRALLTGDTSSDGGLDPFLRNMSSTIANRTVALPMKRAKVEQCQRKIAENPSGPFWARKQGPKRAARWLEDQADLLKKYQGDVARVENDIIEWEKTRIIYRALRDHYTVRHQREEFIDKFASDGYTNPIQLVAAFWLSESRVVRNALFLQIIVTTPEAFENNPEKLKAWAKHFQSVESFNAFFETKTNVRISAKRDT